MSENRLQLSIIVVTHNSAGVLDKCLKALDRGVGGLSCELIVVDNASGDTTLDTAITLWPTAQVIDMQSNRGFAAACNSGAAQAAGEYLLFLNPDVVIDKEAIPALIASVEADDRSGLVSGRLRFSNGSFQATCRNLPTIGNILFSRGAATSRLIGGKGGQYTLPDYRETVAVPAVAATLVIVRKALFDKFGGFDERYFMYMEDTDLSARLHMGGFHNLFVPAAGGVHLWGQGSSAGRIRRLWYHHMSVWRYFLKHIPNGFSVIVLPALLLINLIIRVLVPTASEGETK